MKPSGFNFFYTKDKSYDFFFLYKVKNKFEAYAKENYFQYEKQSSRIREYLKL